MERLLTVDDAADILVWTARPAAATGASLVQLKMRLGHWSTAAAQRYMHAVEGRDA